MDCPNNFLFVVQHSRIVAGLLIFTGQQKRRQVVLFEYTGRGTPGLIPHYQYWNDICTQLAILRNSFVLLLWVVTLRVVYATTVVWAILALKSQTVTEGELYVLQKSF